MVGYDLLILLGFFVGTLLYAVLLSEMIKREDRLFHEYIFIALVAALTLWHGLQFVTLITKQVFGSAALEVYSLFRYWSLYCLAFLPPLIVHVHSSFLDYIQSFVRPIKSWRRYFPLFFYIPVFFIVYFGQYTIIDARKRILDENLSVIPAFVFWLIVCLAASAMLSVRIIRLSRNERWRQFFTVETAIILIVSGLLIYFYFYGGTGNVRLDKSLKNLLRVSSILPTGALIYLLYKYPFYSIVAQRRLLFVMISGAFLTIYIIASKTIRGLADEYAELNADAIEIIIVCLLFLSYEPLKSLARRLTGYLALNQRQVYQSLVRNITEQIVSAPNISELAKAVRSSLIEALRVEEVALFILSRQTPDEEHYAVTQGYGDIKEFDLKKTIRYLQQRRGLYEARKVNIFHLLASEIPYQMYVGITLNNELVGCIAIGKKLTNEDFSYEEQELLLTLSSQLAIAIENIELTKRRSELEGRMFEADKLSSLGMLATSIAHEVKNPLSSIKSIVQSMHDEKIKHNGSGTEIQDLEVINDEINRLRNVVDQLLKFSKPDRVEVNVVDITKMIDTILTILRQEMRQKGIAVFTKFETRPLYLKSSDADLKDILFNLIINAVQSMDHGGKLLIAGRFLDCGAIDKKMMQPGDTSTVHVSELLRPDSMTQGYEVWSSEPVKAPAIAEIESRETDGLENKIVCLSITDTGQGIAQERIQEIFKPFYTTKPTGTGLGLAIVKSKLEALGGRMAVRSLLDVGTTFDIYIPTENKL